MTGTLTRLASLIVVVTLLSSCAVFTRPTDRISFDRQKFINAYARGRILYGAIAEGVVRDCQTGRRTREDCAAKAAIHEQAKVLDSEIRAKIDTPESEFDYELVMKVFEFWLEMAL